MKKTKPTALADRCPACSRFTLHKVQRHCLAFRCGYVESEIKRRRSGRKS